MTASRLISPVKGHLLLEEAAPGCLIVFIALRRDDFLVAASLLNKQTNKDYLLLIATSPTAILQYMFFSCPIKQTVHVHPRKSDLKNEGYKEEN